MKKQDLEYVKETLEWLIKNTDLKNHDRDISDFANKTANSINCIERELNSFVLVDVIKSCDHKWKDSSYYVTTHTEDYECQISGEMVTHAEGYTENEETCTECGEINSL